jgi:hypothetical protein
MRHRCPRSVTHFLSLWKNKGFTEESMAKVGLDAISTSTTLESNKSQALIVW